VTPWITDRHARERKLLEARQNRRTTKETQIRQERFNKGLRGLFDKFTGAYSKTKQKNELESYQALKRNQKQRDALIFRQMDQKREFDRQNSQIFERAHRAQALLKADIQRLNRSHLARLRSLDGPER